MPVEGAQLNNHRGDEGRSNARRHGRVRCERVRTSLGELLDLSASGCRVRFHRRVRPPAAGEVVTLQIEGLDGPFDVRGRATWVKPGGLFRRGEAGIEFVDVGPGERRHLSNLARAATIVEVLGWKRAA